MSDKRPERPTLRVFARARPGVSAAAEVGGEYWAVLEHFYACDDEERVRYYGYDPCVVVEASGPEDALRAAGYGEQLDDCHWDKDSSVTGEVTFSHDGRSVAWDAWTLVTIGPFRRRRKAHAVMDDWRERHSAVVPFGQ